ncbi:MAG: hypothetical protein DWB56_08575 [Candidatus Jettenia sp.]|uniref:Restriction endonuclease n=1 Tax=Candidatus Jettenia caeni TaxID=247490 RepID=I3IK27_9BACT|nr:hypothetical protein [Candidatus Jettenia sp. AMX1]MBC6928998.1 hypothetical protein [Candidatus Jettenia sp.]NUN24575.1 hypothetical protein [Candidatus Jettenia caeni]KAA0249227.1 MAG: hypothetical protein EDM77_09505 [Candidatus Jettenia sp. AMX1]MCE7881103.1 hypothetical protein [Candidatus Jettenia sp. AMX1]MCQ3927177.1 hypothetical protein [Candidatus Jettenia sp.]
MTEKELQELEELRELKKRITDYCNKFDIPRNFLFAILEDQKVTPMIRGKAMEYNAFLLLDKNLPKSIWSVQKLNLNAQPGVYDEDISITHRRSGVILKVESKSAVRGSISDGSRSRILDCSHFKVKCHRSRSNIKLAGTSNDRYALGCFDIVLTNPLNAIFEGNTIGETFEIINDIKIKEMLYKRYSVDNDENLIKACSIDWLYCIPEDIAENGFIPRTPYVKLINDPHWRPINEIEKRLTEVVKMRRNNLRRRS